MPQTQTHTHTHEIKKKTQPLLGKDVGKQQDAFPGNTRRTKFGTLGQNEQFFYT